MLPDAVCIGLNNIVFMPLLNNRQEAPQGQKEIGQTVHASRHHQAICQKAGETHQQPAHATDFVYIVNDEHGVDSMPDREVSR